MREFNDFKELEKLSLDVLSEVVREGEQRVDAQLSAANSGDKRGMSWLGFILAIITASMGATASLVSTGEYYALASISIGFSVLMIISAKKALDAIYPGKFAFPGNEPENWLPENWHEKDSGNQTLKAARVEQAFVLQIKILDNIEIARQSNGDLRQSIAWSLFAVLATITALAFHTIYVWIASTTGN